MKTNIEIIYLICLNVMIRKSLQLLFCEEEVPFMSFDAFDAFDAIVLVALFNGSLAHWLVVRKAIQLLSDEIGLVSMRFDDIHLCSITLCQLAKAISIRFQQSQNTINTWINLVHLIPHLEDEPHQIENVINSVFVCVFFLILVRGKMQRQPFVLSTSRVTRFVIDITKLAAKLI